MASFFILDGDYSHLDDVIINSTEDEAKSEELSNLLFTKDGKAKLDLHCHKFPLDQITQDMKVINVGFAP